MKRNHETKNRNITLQQTIFMTIPCVKGSYDGISRFIGLVYRKLNVSSTWLLFNGITDGQRLELLSCCQMEFSKM